MHRVTWSFLGLAILWFALAPLTSCAGAENSNAVPAGSPLADEIRFQYAVYYLPHPTSEPTAALDELLEAEEADLARVEELPEIPTDSLVAVWSPESIDDYAPPDPQLIQYFGRGLSADQAETLQASQEVFVMDFAHPGDRLFDGMRTANAVAEVVALQTGGLLWDEETREVFTPEAWRERRITSWTGEYPDLTDHTVIHAYNSGEYVRGITLGMAKFGLPDVVIEDFSWAQSRPVGHLIGLLCQAMAEGAEFPEPGEFELDIRSIKNEQVRASQMDSLMEHATASALLSLEHGEWEEGDPVNRLIEVKFDRYSGTDVHAQRDELLSSLFGWEDEIVQVDHDQELLAASDRAKAMLPALRQTFNAGLEPGEFILVKAPFDTPDGGHEWMWVEVSEWHGDVIKGLLTNEPFNIPNLHAGQIVEVSMEDIFDYIRKFADGSQDGNETGAIIQTMQVGAAVE